MRDWIIKDLGWKLFSLFLAVAIWLTVHKIYEEVPAKASGPVAGSTVTFGNLPVQVVSSTLDVHDFRVAPLTVKVTVSGSADDVARLQAGEVHATVDLTEMPSRDLRQPVDVSAPPGITLVSVDPPRVGVIVPPPSDKKP